MKFWRQLRGLGDNVKCKEKLQPWDLWRDYIISRGRRNKSNYFNVRGYPQYTDGANLYSGQSNVCAFYTIDNYPLSLAKEMKEIVRSTLRTGDNIRVSFIDLYEPTEIDWDNPNIKAKTRTWEMIREETQESSAYNKADHIQSEIHMDHREESLLYLSQATRGEGKKLLRIRTMMIISGKRGELYDKYTENITKMLSGDLGLVVTRVTENLQDYMQMYSPFCLEYQSSIRNQVGNFAMTDEHLGQFYTFSQGKVGYEGIYWGTDLESGFPIIKKIKENPTEAENILITAQTGGGKSYYVKALVLQLLGDYRFNGTIMDYEGDEYEPMMGLMKSCYGNSKEVITLNMAEGQGAYFDPVAIGEVTGRMNKEENNPYTMACSYTKSILAALCGLSDNENDKIVYMILDDAIDLTYKKAGVSDNPNTWKLSKDLTLFNVYDSVLELSEQLGYLEARVAEGHTPTPYESTHLDPVYKSNMNRALRYLTRYFAPNVNRNNLFRHPISLEQVKNARLVVCSFGMRGRTPETIDPIQAQLMQIYAANISQIRSLYSKAAGRYNFKIWEEFQRFSMFPNATNVIKTALTGGRKMGDVNLIITNDLEQIIKDDKFAILNSITTAAFGYLPNESTRQWVVDNYSIPESREILDRIYADQQDGQTNSTKESQVNKKLGKYEKGFMIFLNMKVAVPGKMFLPHQLDNSDIFKTGVEVAQRKKKELRRKE